MRRRIATVLIGLAMLGGAAAATGPAAQAATLVPVTCSNGVTFNVDSRAVPFVTRLLNYFNTHNRNGVTCTVGTVGPPVGPPG